MVGAFKDVVRKKDIKGPTDRNFNLEKWEEKWVKLKSDDKKDYDLYIGGKVIDSLLSEIRGMLAKLYSKRPITTKKIIIQSHVAISNRNRAMIIQPDIKDISSVNLNTLSSTNNAFGIDITYQEMAEQSVESITPVLKLLMANEIESSGENSDDDLLPFILEENYLSGLYRVYEDYWQALLWGEYEFNGIDPANKIYEIKQINSRSELIYEITQARKMKLHEHSGSGLYDTDLDPFISARENYMFISGSGKHKKLAVGKVLSAAKRIKHSTVAQKISVDSMRVHYPDGFMDSEYNNESFSIKDAIDVFGQLIIFSESIMARFPKDDSFYNVKKLCEFSPVFKKRELVFAVAKSLYLSIEKAGKIINFISFKGIGNQDLWCHPIINVSEDELVILFAPLNGAVLQRVAEHWFVEFNIDLTDKGTEYEKHIIEKVSRSIKNNPILKNYEIPVSKRIKLSSGEEEIDFLMRLGNKIIVGEAKSILVADSSISHFRTLDVIDGGIEQVNRKMKFVENNIEDIFSIFHWSYNAEEKYTFIPVVFVSNKIHSGFPRGDVFITDEILLAKYLSGDIVPIISENNTEHIAWCELYSDEQQAEANLEKYLGSPPQITMSESDFYYKSMQVPWIKDESFKIVFSRLVPQNTTTADLLNKPYLFPLRKIDNFEEALSDIHFFM